MMPEDIDESKVGMAYGESGSTNNEGLQYTINGKVMEGYVDPSIILNPGEAVTVRMVLPDGYYDQVKQRIWPALISICCPWQQRVQHFCFGGKSDGIMW